ncbi:transcriptional regulator [Sesbania bispinosa]|nr:transcriptional regulator [Sesbania bispinosa]
MDDVGWQQWQWRWRMLGDDSSERRCQLVLVVESVEVIITVKGMRVDGVG